MYHFPFSELVLILYILALSILFVYSSHGFIMLYYNRKYKRDLIPTVPINKLEKVTIQLPIYNEINVVERLINSVCNIDYPKESLEIQVLDDSTDNTVQLIAKLVAEKKEIGFNIHHIRRTNREGFKAGALKEGLKISSGKFIAIFDADFIPPTDFLKKTLPYFYSKNIGMVQTRWEHLNENHSLLTRIQAFALNAHFVIEQEVRNKSHFFINFNGTGGIWRKECIEDAGNWQGDTLTEDLDLSYRAQLKGWEFIYLKNFTTKAELPTDMISLKAQQFRWTKGAIETGKKLLRHVWKSSIPLRTKLQSTFHLTNNLVFPTVLLVALLNIPILFIQETGNYTTLFNLMFIFVIAFVSTLLLYVVAQKEIYQDWVKRSMLFPLFLSWTMGMSVNNTRAVFEGLINKKSDFIRTPKYSSVKEIATQTHYLVRPKISWQLAFEILFTLYSFVGVLIAIYFKNYLAIPFNLMFFVGFFSISILSLKEIFTKK